jgi:D-alanine-D-alanine ligase
MKVAVLHGEVAADAGRDERDALVQAESVSEGLRLLGHEPVILPVSLNLEETVRAMKALRPAMAFNLVETLAGRGSLIHVVPALLDSLKIPYTGAGTGAMLLTSNKVFAKRRLESAGLPTPPWFTDDMHENRSIRGPWLVKSVWEHASVGLDEDSVFPEADRKRLLRELEKRRDALGGEGFAEAFIDGREFNLSLLAGESVSNDPGGTDRRRSGGPRSGTGKGPEVLPPAEIRFDAFPPGKIRVVGYRSKWEEESFEFANTPRSFDFPEADAPLIGRLGELALSCWRLFELRGYARVDFRVDREGHPWILEVNANPCLSPDAGFRAATVRTGFSFPEVLKRILDDLPKGALVDPKSFDSTP